MSKRTLDRNGMPTDLAFTKFYNIFFGIFSPDEIVFLLYVVNLHYLKKAGFSMVKSKPDHSLKCGMSSERLDMCVEKFSDMGLISVDKPKIIASHIRKQKGLDGKTQTPVSFEAFREREFDRIADIVRASVDMDAIYRIVRGEV